MQFYIRGAWRNFSGRSDGGVESRKTEFPRSSKDNTSSRSDDHFQEWDEHYPPPSPQLITTSNLLALKTFYSAFTDSTPLFLSPSKCDIRFENNQHVLLIDERMIKRGEKRDLEKRVHNTAGDRRNGEQKTIVLESVSIAAFLAAYRRVCGHGILPIQGFIDGASIGMVFEDPAGNTVELHASVPSSVTGLEVFSKDAIPGMRGRRRNIDPEVLCERVWSWNETWNAEARGDEEVAAGG